MSINIIVITFINNIIVHAGAQFNAVMGLEIIEHVDEPHFLLSLLSLLL